LKRSQGLEDPRGDVQEKDGSDEDESEDDDDVRVAVLRRYDCRVKLSRLSGREEEEDRK
jgi:hypothetical protein